MLDLADPWRMSRYCRFIPTDDGGGYLHNSFMGALARLDPATVTRLSAVLLPLRHKNRAEQPLLPVPPGADPALAEFARQGFAVPESLNEAEKVPRLIEKERDWGTHFIILPHEDCNFRCTYCYETFERGKMRPPMVAAVKRMVEDRIDTIRFLNIGWFGGEPCLARDVIYDLSDHFQALCRARDIPFRAAMTTNGYFLDDVTVTRLLAAGVQHFQITIDGSEEAHDDVRRLRGGQPTYRRIFRNLVGMAARDDRFTVAVRVNFTPQTVATIESFLTEAAPHLAGDDRFFLDFHAVGRWGGPNDATMSVVEDRSAADTRLDLVARSECHGFSPASLADALKPHGAACYAGKASSMVIGSDGTIYKCTVAFEDDRNKVGRLHPDGRLEIDAAKWKMWTEPVSTSGKCGTCSFSAACQSRSCPLATIEAQEPPCPYTDHDFERMVRAAARPAPAADQPTRTA